MDGAPVTVSHGLTETLEQLERRTPEFQDRARKFLTRLCTHYVLDGGALAAAHAGIIAPYQGRASGRVREFCMYGQTTGETDEWGLPVRHDWAQEYRGDALVVYGHTPVSEPGWFNNTINIDTGCVFGGRLTALRYPERELVSVPAARMYYEPAKPPEEPRGGSQNTERPDHALDINDVNGSRAIETETRGRISINTKQAAAALEAMSRYALDPRWLVYMPPTISPTEASALPGILEHPAQAFAQYREDGIETVVCEEKHMGSRAILAIGRDEEEIRRKFGDRQPRGRGLLHPHRAAVLHGPRHGTGVPHAGPGGHRKERPLGRAPDRLAAPRLRDHAVVVQGRRAAETPVRPRRRRRGQHPGHNQEASGAGPGPGARTPGSWAGTPANGCAPCWNTGRPTGSTAGTWSPWTRSGPPHSTCSPPRGRP